MTEKPATYSIRATQPVDYAARVAAGEQFTEAQRRDAILSGGIVPSDWLVDIAGTLGVDLPAPIPTEEEFLVAVAKLFGGRCHPGLVREAYKLIRNDKAWPEGRD